MSFSSQSYWIDRYKNNGNSGAGSRGNLAEYKVKFLNTFVETNAIGNVVELGCGDGVNLIGTNYTAYTGYDISPVAIEQCKKLHSQRPNYSFFVLNDDTVLRNCSCELVLSLDVIFHLTEDAVYELYLKRLLSLSNKWLIIYSSSESSTDFEKKYGRQGVHVKGRNFVEDIAKFDASWSLVKVHDHEFPYDKRYPNRTSFSKFHVFRRRE